MSKWAEQKEQLVTQSLSAIADSVFVVQPTCAPKNTNRHKSY